MVEESLVGEEVPLYISHMEEKVIDLIGAP